MMSYLSPLGSTSDGERLSGPGLSVREHRRVVPVENVGHGPLSDLSKHIVLVVCRSIDQHPVSKQITVHENLNQPIWKEFGMHLMMEIPETSWIHSTLFAPV